MSKPKLPSAGGSYDVAKGGQLKKTEGTEQPRLLQKNKPAPAEEKGDD